MRRKSSSFRPHNWIYPAQPESGISGKPLSLEQLPIVILESIFDYLQTPDLLQLCLVSRYFYLPAANRIYQCICITDDSLIIQYSKREMRNWNRNYCTVITSGKLINLLEVVARNEKLAAMVHTINITRANCSSVIPDLLLPLRLKSFHHAGPLDIPAGATQTLQELTCFLPSSPLHAQNLYELKIYHSNEDSDSDRYAQLAMSLIKSRSFQNLRKLVFQRFEERSLNSLNVLNRERLAADTRPPWITFFETFTRSNHILNLNALGLDGNVGNSGELVAHKLDEAIYLKELVTLELRHTENTHPGRAHNTGVVTFLEALTNSTQSLECLSISHTDNCLTCQIDAVTQVLKNNLSHQLKSLSMKIEPRTSADTEAIEHLILAYQKNLVRIQFEDRSTVVSSMAKVTKDLDLHQHRQWSDDWYYGDRARQVFTPRILELENPRPYVNEAKRKLIKICQKSILKFLNSNIIYSGATTNLPFLTEYSVLDLHFNMKQRGIFTNGETVLFE